ncbi:MAG: GGDEF domain-containing protein [Tepidisphaeraceae bacterium]
MVAADNILLIADRDRQVHDALASAVPGANITRAATVFDGIAELHQKSFGAVLTSVEPIERRPEPAVRTLRELAGPARLVLFGHSTLEPLSRKMLEFGCDDYFLTPADPHEIRQILSAESPVSSPIAPTELLTEPTIEPAPTQPSDAPVAAAPLAEVMLDALLSAPNLSLQTSVRELRARLGKRFPLSFVRGDVSPDVLAHPIRNESRIVGHLVLERAPLDTTPHDRHLLAQLAALAGKVALLEERHARLQKLAITDELTGLYNGRYFGHFLRSILDKARLRRFPVTLLLFDIDNFKKYNDTYGHGVGDDILRQSAALMKKCVRDHDLVARISGDEFAVVFWEKEGPRTPRDPNIAGHSRVPQTPMIIASRFRRLLGTSQFTALGAMGRGTLTISGGMSVFPYDAQTAEGLIEAADRALMFGAKKSGKNSISLVGDGGVINDESPK